ncbi:MAG: hypothetical protein L6Q46_03675 [Flavobacterium sp.]|uniref:hypothetical protein n=1 Tax=Flavobacterium sp. TaxID=239 RepID=UPI0025C11158|nr:hypothetical protein [Flavobacterium sp.]MCK6607387.1 hypothetical protein [Flavobacterium sp.]
MWTFIIVLVAIISIWAIISNKNDNEKTREYFNNKGGLKTIFPNLVNILENEYDMTLKYDDGRKFCFKKIEDDKELNIGLKLEFNNVKVIFSELHKKGNLLRGTDVTFHSDNDYKELTKLIQLSIANLNTSINTQFHQKKYLKEWEDFISTSKNENFIDFHVKNLFMIDDIDPKKFLLNLRYKKIGFDIDNEQTSSMNEIYFTPPAFTDFFIAAYPDVYLWVQKNYSRVEAYKNLEKESEDYFKYIENLIPMYRKMINQYKRENNQLECR